MMIVSVLGFRFFPNNRGNPLLVRWRDGVMNRRQRAGPPRGGGAEDHSCLGDFPPPRFSPDHFRAADLALNAPMPDSTVPEGHIDFRHNRLPIGHADRRPWIYFTSAVVGFVGLSAVRGLVTKSVYSMWPAKDVWAAATVDVDLRQIREGQNFVTKWRGKPIFVKRRGASEIEMAKKDDALITSLRDPELDVERAPKAEWLILIGVCTHLGRQ